MIKHHGEKHGYLDGTQIEHKIAKIKYNVWTGSKRAPNRAL
jgi:hypothetical protein